MKKYLYSTPLFYRYLSLLSDIGKFSIARSLQFEVLRELKFTGDILDIGGGEKASYRDFINGGKTYSSININDIYSPKWVVNIGDQFPIDDKSIDTVLSMNTLEHVFDAQFICDEMFRVLKDKGEVFVFVPFMFPIHADPDDFFRPTPSWFNSALMKSGFKNINIYPLYWGMNTTALTCTGAPGPLKKIRYRIALTIDMLLYYLRGFYHQKDEQKYNCSSPVALFVHAVK